MRRPCGTVLDGMGRAGYDLAGRALLGGSARDVLSCYGPLRGLPRLALLALFARKPAEGELVMDGICVAAAHRGSGIGGLYVAANPIADLVEAQARHLDVLGVVTFFTSTELRIGDIDDPRRLAATIRPLDENAARHEHFAAFAETCADRLARGADLSGAERLTLAVELAAEFSRAMTPDPLFPRSCCPGPGPIGRGGRRR
ncbi:hypothetical protein [Streptomyces sp. NPDC059802]|uniref:hypothetical protein n=1 Tax=Streptomyces sp. NPDC059802 TaxID=3346952 RepID=UPI003662574B